MTPLLAVRGRTRRSGQVVGNDAVDFTVAPGGVHAVLDQEGTVRVAAGTVPDYKTIESTDYVVGRIPAS